MLPRGPSVPLGVLRGPCRVARRVWYIVVHLLTPLWLYVRCYMGVPVSDLLGTTVACRSRDQGAGRT